MPAIEYPEGDLGGQLRRAAQILGADMGVRVLFVSQDGFDTHSNQAEAHGNLLKRFPGRSHAFQRDLAARKLADRVVVMVFSEFGRRVDENASLGTDHGAASCMFLVGGKVKGGLVGQYPSLAKLGDGDLIYQHRLPLGLRHPPRPLARLPPRNGPGQAVAATGPDRGCVSTFGARCHTLEPLWCNSPTELNSARRAKHEVGFSPCVKLSNTRRQLCSTHFTPGT